MPNVTINRRVLFPRIQTVQGIPTQAEFTTWYNAVVANGGTITSNQQTEINKGFYYLKQAGIFTELDMLQIFVGGSLVAPVDFKDPTRIGTNTGCTWDSVFGITGTGGSNFYCTNYNPGVGTGWKYTQDDNSWGLLTLSNTAISASFSYISSASAGLATINAFFNDYNSGADAYKGATNIWNNQVVAVGTYSNRKAVPWYNNFTHVKRSSSSFYTRYQNSAPVCTITKASSAVQNCKFSILGNYANNAVLPGGGTNGAKIGAVYAGSSNIDCGTLQAIIGTYFIEPFSTDSFNKLAVFVGDSFAGTQNSATESVSSTYPKRVLANLGAGWTGCVLSTGGSTTGDLLSDWSTYVAPITATDFRKKILVVHTATNDFYLGNSASTVYSNYQTIASQAKALGFKVVFGGCVARDASAGSGGQAAFDAKRVSLQNTMLGDFTTSVGTNIYTGASWADGYVDHYAFSEMQNFNDTTYFQGDKAHLTTAGYNIFADAFANLIAIL